MFDKERLVGSMKRITDTKGRAMQSDREISALPANHLSGRENYVTDSLAYREIRESIEGVYGLIYFLRSGLPDNRLTLQQLCNFALGLHALPIYLALRKENPVPENDVPPAVIDIARTAIGIVSPVDDIIFQGNSSQGLMSSDEIYRFAEGDNPKGRNYFLSRFDNRSCPAPAKEVKRVLDAMINKPDDNLVAEGNLRWGMLMSVDDLSSIMEFGYLYKRMVDEGVRGRGIPPGCQEAKIIALRQQHLYLMMNPALGYNI